MEDKNFFSKADELFNFDELKLYELEDVAGGAVGNHERRQIKYMLEGLKKECNYSKEESKAYIERKWISSSNFRQIVSSDGSAEDLDRIFGFIDEIWDRV